jgi:hypothetical protein
VLFLINLSAVAHCLYVLTDDNYPAINEVRSNAAYTSCMLEVVRLESGLLDGKEKEIANKQSVTLSVLVSGMYLRNPFRLYSCCVGSVNRHSA